MKIKYLRKNHHGVQEDYISRGSNFTLFRFYQPCLSLARWKETKLLYLYSRKTFLRTISKDEPNALKTAAKKTEFLEATDIEFEYL